MMNRFQRSRSERVVAAGRLAIAFFVLGAVWLDPSQPAQLPGLTHALLLLYAALSVVLFYSQRVNRLAPTHLGLPAQPLELGVHLFEVGLFAFLLYATDGLASPYFPLFTYSILSATLRWSWKGALWTSVAVLVLVVVAAVIQLKLLPPLEFEIDRFLIRCAHVVVVGGMLVYFAFHQQKVEGELLRLRRWDLQPADLVGLPTYAASCVRYLAEVFVASRAVVVIQDRDEPWAICARYEDGVLRQERLTAEGQEALEGDASEALLLGGDADRALLALSEDGQATSLPTPESFRRTCHHLGARHLLSVPFRSDLFQGRLLVLDRPDFTAEEMLTASLLARQIESGLGRFEALHALSRAAAFEERLRMARDLHDGVLQTLSAAAMHLEAIRRSPSEDQLRMAALQEWLQKEQRELRHLIERLRSDAGPDSPEPDAGASSSLTEIVEGVTERWGIPVELSCSPPGLSLDAGTGFQLQQIIREAAANAVRHGGATRLAVTLTAEAAEEGRLGIRLLDDGTGLERHGAFDAEQCSALGIGPRNLRDRVGALGGTFRLLSRPQGLQIDLSLPWEAPS